MNEIKRCIEEIKSIQYHIIDSVDKVYNKGIIPLQDLVQKDSKFNTSEVQLILSKLLENGFIEAIKYEIKQANDSIHDLVFYEDTLRVLESKNPYKLNSYENVDLDIDIANTKRQIAELKSLNQIKEREYLRQLLKLLVFQLEKGLK